MAFLYERYHYALLYPATEFVHLFEIAEAIEKHFGGGKDAKKFLTTDAPRNVLGRLANDAPVLEGRHNGKHHDQLRPATSDERQRARQAAKDLIQAFANTL